MGLLQAISLLSHADKLEEIAHDIGEQHKDVDLPREDRPGTPVISIDERQDLQVAITATETAHLIREEVASRGFRS